MIKAVAGKVVTVAIGSRMYVKDEDTGETLFELIGNHPLSPETTIIRNGVTYKIERVEIEVQDLGLSHHEDCCDGHTHLFVSVE